MITIGKHVLTARWSSDFWIVNGNRQYIKFTKNIRPYVTTYGLIFFNLAFILGIATDEN